MSGRISAATERALAMIGKPRGGGRKWSAYAAAKVQGIDLTTIYRALKRKRQEAKR